jgi:hypothetical protein
MVGPECNVVFDDGGTLKIFENTPFIPSRKVDLRQTLIAIQRAMVLIPTIDLVIKKLVFLSKISIVVRIFLVTTQIFF